MDVVTCRLLPFWVVPAVLSPQRIFAKMGNGERHLSPCRRLACQQWPLRLHYAAGFGHCSLQPRRSTKDDRSTKAPPATAAAVSSFKSLDLIPAQYTDRAALVHQSSRINLLLSCHYQQQVMARSVDPLVVGKVIGDVIDMFVPSVDMAVLYASRQVNNGCQMKPSATALAPDIQVSDKNVTNELFTLVMTDPDAPSPSEPSMREWVHWIVTDIPGHSTESSAGYMLLKERVVASGSKGREVVPYMGPRPPIGIHRYIFVLFKQPTGPIIVSPPPTRNNFNTRNFAGEYGLGLPVAATYFNAQKEPGNRRR